jgi:hypothetical protein
MPFTPPIPSPYNFVPLSGQVFFPDWADHVSMDVPFSDGISGWFEIEVEAKTDIYIRNGGDQPRTAPEKAADSVWQDFFRVTPEGRYAIPGTSLKGVVRSVMEIATFGKLNRAYDARYGVRDLQNTDRRLYLGWMTTERPPHQARPKGRLAAPGRGPVDHYSL